MTETEPLKISLCTTCKNRFDKYLRHTLPANLKAAESYPNVEFVVLDYGDEQGLGDWIKENFQDEIESGRLRYVFYPDAEYFKMSHAKNMAHRMATGDVLCNLDADNYIGEGFLDYLNESFHNNGDIIVRPERRIRCNGGADALLFQKIIFMQFVAMMRHSVDGDMKMINFYEMLRAKDLFYKN